MILFAPLPRHAKVLPPPRLCDNIPLGLRLAGGVVALGAVVHQVLAALLPLVKHVLATAVGLSLIGWLVRGEG